MGQVVPFRSLKRYRLRAGPPVEALQIIAGGVLPRFTEELSPGRYVVTTSHMGRRAAKVGDWVIIDEHLDVSIVGDFMFRQIYEPLPDPL